MDTDIPRQRSAPTIRTAILDAAEFLFAEYGYSATSTAQIAETAGVDKALVPHLFRTKIEILTTLVEEKGSRRVLETIEPPVRDGDIEAALVELASLVRDQVHLSPQLLQIMFREKSLIPLAQFVIAAFLSRLDTLVRDTIMASIPSNTPPAHLGPIAQMFSALLAREALLQQITVEKSDLHPAASACAVALNTVQTPEAEPEEASTVPSA
jgi:AcrR family transcriptional regulator